MKTRRELLAGINAGFADEAALAKFIKDEGLTVDLTAAKTLDEKIATVKSVVETMPDAMPVSDFEAAMAAFATAAATAETPEQRIERIVKELAAKPGAMKIENIGVTKTAITQRDGYVQIGLSLTKPLPTFDASGKIIAIYAYTDTAIAIGAILTANGYGDIVDWAINHNGCLANIFSDVKIDVITEFVAAGNHYVNPFSTGDRDFVARNNRINHYCYKIELGERGRKEVEEIHAVQRMQ